jgi:hypothetical protein
VPRGQIDISGWNNCRTLLELSRFSFASYGVPRVGDTRLRDCICVLVILVHLALQMPAIKAISKFKPRQASPRPQTNAGASGFTHRPTRTKPCKPQRKAKAIGGTNPRDHPVRWQQHEGPEAEAGVGSDGEQGELRALGAASQ